MSDERQDFSAAMLPASFDGIVDGREVDAGQQSEAQLAGSGLKRDEEKPVVVIDCRRFFNEHSRFEVTPHTRLHTANKAERSINARRAAKCNDILRLGFRSPSFVSPARSTHGRDTLSGSCPTRLPDPSNDTDMPWEPVA